MKSELLGQIRAKLTPQEMQACGDPAIGRLAKVIIARTSVTALPSLHGERRGIDRLRATAQKSQQGMCPRWCYMLAHNAIVVGGGRRYRARQEKTI